MDKPNNGELHPPPTSHERNPSRPNHHLHILNPIQPRMPFELTTTNNGLPMGKPKGEFEILMGRKKRERRRLPSSIKRSGRLQFPIKRMVRAVVVLVPSVQRHKGRKKVLNQRHCGMFPCPNINPLVVDPTMQGRKNHRLFGMLRYQNMNRFQNKVK